MDMLQEMYDKITELTDVDYEGYVNKETEKVLVTSESIECMLMNLIYKIDELYERIGDLEKDIRENYQLIPDDPYEDYCVSEHDFH